MVPGSWDGPAAGRGAWLAPEGVWWVGLRSSPTMIGGYHCLMPGTTAENLDATLRTIVEDVIPFNRLLGLRVAVIDRAASTITLELPVRDEHIGNVVRRMPHGGLIAALVDAASGAAAALTLDDLSQAPSVATIDMRVDFLKPGRGAVLRAEARVMRGGRSVIVVRTDVLDEDGTLLALGSSAFAVERVRPAG